MQFRPIVTRAFCVLMVHQMTMHAGMLFAQTTGAKQVSEADRLFVGQVLPVMKSKCFVCHADDKNDLKGEFSLASRADLLKGGESGEPGIVPGKPEESPVYKSIRWDELEMPPKENDRLNEEQIASFRKWIAAGAPWPDQKTILAIQKSLEHTDDHLVPVATSGGQTQEWTNRKYDSAKLWALQPITMPKVPTDYLRGSKNPIDAFVNRKLAAAGLERAPRADDRTLERRLFFGLTGLLPGNRESDKSEPSFDDLIDRLLSSPRYGERMAQHWLDVARYADTSGYSNDWERPHAWRYRDYVIRSFNEDKPFNRFVVEQIAGDELLADDPEMSIAVGYLRMGPWEQTGMSVAAVTRQLWLDDVTNIVGETFLGHSLRCAKCHDHKFDPIPTRDYYRIQAAFASTQFADKKASRLPSEAKPDRARLQTWAKQFSEEGLIDLTKLQGDNAFMRIKKKLNEYRQRAIDRFAEMSFSVQAAKAEKVSILNGGALERPGDEVEPGVLSCIDSRALPTSDGGRRLGLARWIADAQNPLTSRVIVNRIWQWHFGTGLVATPNNFGINGSQPSHPELLDFLAAWLIENDWSIKDLHRLILTSETYQRSTHHPDPRQIEARDPEGRMLACFRPRRLSAEEVRDSMLAATGELKLDGGGPGVFPEIQWEVALQPRHIMGAIATPYRPSLTPKLRNRRTIYTFRYRGLSHPMLEVLNRPNADLSCERRDETLVPTQAFALFNGQFARDRSIALANRIFSENLKSSIADDLTKAIHSAFQRILGRSPTAEQVEAVTKHFLTMREIHCDSKLEPKQIPKTVQREMIAEQTGKVFRWQEQMGLEGYQPDLQAHEVDADTRALADVCLVLLNSSEFLYVY